MVKASVPKTGYAGRLKAILDAPPEQGLGERPLRISEGGSNRNKSASSKERSKASRDKEIAEARAKKRVADGSAVVSPKETSGALVVVEHQKRKEPSAGRDLEAQKSKKPRSSGRGARKSEDKPFEEGPSLSSRSSCARLFRSIKNAPSDIVAMSRVSGTELYADTASKFCTAIAAFNRYTDWAESYVEGRSNEELTDLRAALEKEKILANKLSLELLNLNERAIAAEGKCTGLEKELAEEKENVVRAYGIVNMHHVAVAEAKKTVKDELKGLLQERLGRVQRHLADVKKSGELTSAYSVVAGTKEGLDMLAESGVEVPSGLVETVSADLASALKKVTDFDIFDLEEGDLDAGHLIASFDALEAERERKDEDDNPPTPFGGDDEDVGDAALKMLGDVNQERDETAEERIDGPGDGRGRDDEDEEKH